MYGHEVFDVLKSEQSNSGHTFRLMLLLVINESRVWHNFDLLESLPIFRLTSHFLAHLFYSKVSQFYSVHSITTSITTKFIAQFQ
jgi:hypothetical protein